MKAGMYGCIYCDRCECEEEGMVRYGNRCVNKILERCDTACNDLVCANGRYIVSASKFLCEFVTSVSMVLVYVCY